MAYRYKNDLDYMPSNQPKPLDPTGERRFPPGLLSREEIRREKDHVIVRETWDVTVPGCPIIVVTGGAPDPNVVTVTRETPYPYFGKSDLEN